MISTSTRLQTPRPADGSLRDLDPTRRAARLRDGGVGIVRRGPLDRIVRFPDGSSARRRTFAGAERSAHAYLDAR